MKWREIGSVMLPCCMCVCHESQCGSSSSQQPQLSSHRARTSAATVREQLATCSFQLKKKHTGIKPMVSEMGTEHFTMMNTWNASKLNQQDHLHFSRNCSNLATTTYHLSWLTVEAIGVPTWTHMWRVHCCSVHWTMQCKQTTAWEEKQFCHAEQSQFHCAWLCWTHFHAPCMSFGEVLFIFPPCWLQMHPFDHSWHCCHHCWAQLNHKQEGQLQALNLDILFSEESQSHFN